jgi:glycine C-acetyltransferase
MSRFQRRADMYVKRYLTGPSAQVLRTVKPLQDGKAYVSLDGESKTVLHFGSNNYLGLSNHPYVIEQAKKYLDEYGLSMCGSPLLNGGSDKHRELELRLAAFKGAEDAIIFPSGFSANLAWTQALVLPGDEIYFDKYAHTSFVDGVRHINREHLHALEHNRPPQAAVWKEGTARQKFVFIEGVYSMHGNIAALNDYVRWCKENDGVLVVDDAHGTGTIGKTGKGVFEYWDSTPSGAILVGTLSKGLGGVGGYICADKDVVTCLRASANSGIFSASLPPSIVGGVHAALELLEREPERVGKLQKNIKQLAKHLAPLGVNSNHESPIISISVHKSQSIQKIVRGLHDDGIYVNGVSYPAVPKSEQRIRISLSSDHAAEDISFLSRALINRIGR